MKEIKEELGNLEGCLADIKDQNNLIDLLINNYFDKGNISNDKDVIGMILEYKRSQSLIFTVSKILKDVEEKVTNNIALIYEKIK